jgi:hypothetical protein
LQEENFEDILKGWDEETVLDPDPGLKIYFLGERAVRRRKFKVEVLGKNQMADCLVSVVAIPCAIHGGYSKTYPQRKPITDIL